MRKRTTATERNRARDAINVYRKGRHAGTRKNWAAGDATSEREQGRSLLHRGKAADALVHLERALKGFQDAGDRAGEASTRARSRA